MRLVVSVLAFAALLASINRPALGQRITTIQLDGVQYFISRMNPYSPELNFFLAYQYCRSLGLQLASFETREKADSIRQYLINAGYTKFDFWTSGNKLGTDMFLWMSTGLPFNATFNYMKRPGSDVSSPDAPSGSTAPQRTARDSGGGSSDGCVALTAPTLDWDTADCGSVKDFICEQTRCYYYNYGSIPVSSAQGLRPSTTPRMPVSPLIRTRPSEAPATSGPYDSGAEPKDEPSQSNEDIKEAKEKEKDASDYVSTILPENLATFKTIRIEKSKIPSIY